MSLIPQEKIENKVARYFAALQWQVVATNPSALKAMERRINHAIASQGVLTYSQLVDGIDFYLPKSDGSQLYRIDLERWSGSDGGIVGEFLCYISMQSFIQQGVLASAVVVKSSGKISSGFFELAEILGLLKHRDDASDEAFWQTEKGYVYNPRTASNRAVPYE